MRRVDSHRLVSTSSRSLLLLSDSSHVRWQHRHRQCGWFARNPVTASSWLLEALSVAGDVVLDAGLLATGGML
jgi:hypothetical protein